jgi:hypothetical protein
MTLRRWLPGLLTALISFALFVVLLEATVQIYTRLFIY